MEIKPIPSWRNSRQHRRVRLTTRVESRATGVATIGSADNVSVGGLLVIARDTFESGTEVVVRFDLPSGHAVEAQGVVVHALTGERMGIQFHALKLADVDAIEEFVGRG
jgi:hypothetical protein